MVKWIKLTRDFKCPACPSQSSSAEWTCGMDGDAVFLNERAVIECASGKHSKRVVDHKWNCGSSYHNGESKKADLEGFTFSISQAVQLMSEAGSEWVASLIIELGKQYGKWYY